MMDNLLRTHAGNLPAPDDDFFVPLPAEIGEPLSVQTNWKQGKPIVAAQMQLLFWMVVIGLGALAAVLMAIFTDAPHIRLFGFLSVLLLLIVGWIVHRMVRLPEVTYVGKEGWSRHTHRQLTSNEIDHTVLRFDDAQSLSVEEYSINVEMLHLATGFSYVWKDESGQPMAKIVGDFRPKSDPQSRVTHCFAKAAEIAWTEHWLQSHRPDFEASGYYAFHYDHQKDIHVGDGILEFHWKGNVHQATPADIREITVETQRLRILFHNREIMSRGRFVIGVNELPNFLAFIIALQRHFGYDPQFQTGT